MPGQHSLLDPWMMIKQNQSSPATGVAALYDGKVLPAPALSQCSPSVQVSGFHSLKEAALIIC